MEKIIENLTGLQLSLPMAMFVAGASFYALILIAQSIWALITPNNSDLTQSNQSKSKRNVRNQILLLGPSGSGKTTLFYKLIARQDYQTVSSSEVNYSRSGLLIPKTIVGSETDITKQVNLSDVPGHYNYRSKLQENFLIDAQAIFIVIDSKDKDRIVEAAETLYEVLSDIELVSAGVPILIACNKQDLTFAKRAIQMERDLQIEIE